MYAYIMFRKYYQNIYILLYTKRLNKPMSVAFSLKHLCFGNCVKYPHKYKFYGGINIC